MSRVVGVDLGSRRIGVAVSDGARSMAFPRPHVARSGDREVDHAAIAAVVEEVGATILVVGLPLSMDGRQRTAAAAAAEEAEALARLLEHRGVAVETFDERLTTVSAAGALTAAGKRGRHQRGSVDSAAATVLLDAWLAAR